MHELAQDSTSQLPSDRSFGLTIGLALAACSAWWAWRRHATGLALAGLSLALLILAASLIAPRSLRPFNAAWMKFGALLNSIVGPMVLGLIYFALITPMAVAMRLRGRDALHRRFDPNASTYWVNRVPPGPDAKQSFPLQF